MFEVEFLAAFRTAHDDGCCGAAACTPAQIVTASRAASILARLELAQEAVIIRHHTPQNAEERHQDHSAQDVADDCTSISCKRRHDVGKPDHSSQRHGGYDHAAATLQQQWFLHNHDGRLCWR